MKINVSFFKKIGFVVSVTAFSMVATGCASIVSGHNESVSVKTSPIKGATCELENNKGKWIVASTPGNVTIHRSFEKLTVTCEKKGYKKSIKRISSSTKPIAYGNVIFGGVLGAGIDIASGAAYDYPKDIDVNMMG